MCAEWLKNMDEGKITGVVSLDIKKDLIQFTIKF
jgi:hypothetical protein